ncbi:MAG TPA: serine hydrolase [Thermoanaerobaculia bacterium]|nr:serine hydrolase [Thermoanaerobaculia bacterium]
MKTCFPFLVAALALPAAPAAFAADPVAADPRVVQALDLARTWLEAQRAYEQVPGLSAAVVHDQELLWTDAFGFADPAGGRKARPDTIYSICSISKLFTAIAVMQQRDAGKLRLDDPVSRHLPWFTMKPGGRDGTEITVEGLLTHAAGLPREADVPYWSPPLFAFPTREKVIERLAGQQALYPPETYFQYSNLGLTLAGEVAAAAAGVPYDTYVRKNVLEPLKLSSTTPEMPEGERGGRLAAGFSARGRDGRRTPVPFFTAKGIAPAAGFASTAQDLARFASWQFRLLSAGGAEVLRASTLREMQRVHWVDPDFKTMWGLGFAVEDRDGTAFVGHGGSCPGYRTALLLQPRTKLATIVMANASGVDVGDWGRRLYDIVAPATTAAEKEPGKAKPADPELRRYAGAYDARPWGGEIAVLPWDDGLALLALPTDDPVKGLVKLKKTGEHTFRRIRKDETLGEEVVFELDADGNVERLKRHGNFSVRLKP